MYARLDSAVVTSGVLLAESQRKTVEHLEGGILGKLLVKAGDRVEEGQVVALLDATQVRAQLAQLEGAAAGALLRHLAAGGGGGGRGRARSGGGAGGGRRRRRRRSGRSSRRGSGRMWRRSPRCGAQIDQLRAQIVASKAQAQAAERQLASWTEERALNLKLVEKGATPRQKLLEFDRTIASLEGQRDAQRGLAPAATEDIARAETDIETLEQQRLVEIGQRLAEARRQVEALASQIVAARDVVARSELRAPQAGVVVHVYIVTPGAVVPSGQPVMDIVPDGDPLVVETRLPPEAIDTVHVGRKAQVRLTAYRRADAPVLDGEVIYVSADLSRIRATAQSYFDARVSLDRAGLKGRPDVTLSSGMPVEVAIQTGERRAGDYFLEPIVRRFGRAMREEYDAGRM